MEFDGSYEMLRSLAINVIPMDRAQILPNRTVLIRGERIAAVAEGTAARVPHDCAIIDGQRRYLIPGGHLGEPDARGFPSNHLPGSRRGRRAAATADAIHAAPSNE